MTFVEIKAPLTRRNRRGLGPGGRATHLRQSTLRTVPGGASLDVWTHEETFKHRWQEQRHEYSHHGQPPEWPDDPDEPYQRQPTEGLAHATN
jgi:hypothetical protein